MYYNKRGQRINIANVNIDESLGGFDAVIGNPPWERVEVSDDDFFRPIYWQQTRKAWSGLSKSLKEKFKNNVLKNTDLQCMYTNAKNHVMVLRKYFTKIYTAQGGGHAEMFKLFTEKSLSLLSKKSTLGLIIPSAIYSDVQCAELRKILFRQTSVQHILSFINTKAIFKDVHRQYNFCVVILHSGNSTQEFGLSYKLKNLSDIAKPPAVQVSTQTIERTSGDSMAVLEANYTDYNLIKKMRLSPVLSSDQWNFISTVDFNMTIDKDLFKRQKTKTRLPLYEGKTIAQFSINGPIRYHIERDKGSKRLLDVEMSRISKMRKKFRWSVCPKPQIDIDSYRLAWREVSNAVDYRTVYATILPRNVFHGHSLWTVKPNIISTTGHYNKQHTNYELGYMCGLFNSLPFDWYMRRMVRLNITKTIMSKMPVPIFDANNPNHMNISKLTWRLICVHDEYSEIKNQLKIDPIYTIEKRIQAEAQLSAYSAIIYNLDIVDLKYICKQFNVFISKRPTFMECVLEQYIALTKQTS